MTQKHTPGPWHRNIRAEGKYPTIFSGKNDHVASVNSRSDKDEMEANIDLIAAAPDMLEALKRAAYVLKEHGDMPWVLRDIEQAIAKAEGGAA